jgi:hypothetical protein
MHLVIEPHELNAVDSPDEVLASVSGVHVVNEKVNDNEMANEVTTDVSGDPVVNEQDSGNEMAIVSFVPASALESTCLDIVPYDGTEDEHNSLDLIPLVEDVLAAQDDLENR